MQCAHKVPLVDLHFLAVVPEHAAWDRAVALFTEKIMNSMCLEADCELHAGMWNEQDGS